VTELERESGKATLLLVGDRANIEAGVRELKIGELVLIGAKANGFRSEEGYLPSKVMRVSAANLR
jgi:hypothetical protein